MKELIRIRLSGTEFALTEEAFNTLRNYLEEYESALPKEQNRAQKMAELESNIVEKFLNHQPRESAVELPLVETTIAALGYPEGYTPNATTKRAQTQPTTPQSEVGVLGRIVIVGGKIILGVMLAVWILAAIGLLVGFVTLMAIGDIWADYLALPMDGISPVVFAGLVCAVIVLFMGVVSDLGFRLISGRRVNLRKLAVAGVIWLIFLLWLIFASVRNADNWVVWAQQSAAKIELWERDYDNWEDMLEEQLESAIFNPTLVDGAETNLTFYLYDLGDSLKLDKLCEEFDELYRYDDHILGYLIDGKDVVIEVVISQENNIITRKTTITTPDGVTTLNVSVDKGSGRLLEYNTEINNVINN